MADLTPEERAAVEAAKAWTMKANTLVSAIIGTESVTVPGEFIARWGFGCGHMHGHTAGWNAAIRAAAEQADKASRKPILALLRPEAP